ncbi:MAG TPA: hypothetical protein VM925_27765, partial [Labilithrix sp.]|nr:hypothetical protein [Labilithrix sp.]
KCTTSANETTGSTASDRVFRVTAHKAGTMTVTVSDASYNVFLWASAACLPEPNAYITCANAAIDKSSETVTFPVELNKTYFVFVDGAGPGDETTRQGDFRVTFSIP